MIPFFTNPDTHVSGDFTLSPLGLWCRLVDSRSSKSTVSNRKYWGAPVSVEERETKTIKYIFLHLYDSVVNLVKDREYKNSSLKENDVVCFQIRTRSQKTANVWAKKENSHPPSHLHTEMKWFHSFKTISRTVGSPQEKWPWDSIIHIPRADISER